jgi:hypothetical protein
VATFGGIVIDDQDVNCHITFRETHTGRRRTNRLNRTRTVGAHG